MNPWEGLSPEMADSLQRDLAPHNAFLAFALDVRDLNAEEDESRVPIRWLGAAQVATRLGEAAPRKRKEMIATWVRQAADDGPDGVWTALSVPGLVVRDAESACLTLVAFARQAREGGALYLAYCIAMNTRLAMLHTGPAHARARATFEQALVLRERGEMDRAEDTFEAALEDAIRGGDAEIEAAAGSALEEIRRMRSA